MSSGIPGELRHREKYTYFDKTQQSYQSKSKFGCSPASVVDTDEVLPELLSDGGALLGDHGLLVHADQDGLVRLHDVHTTDKNEQN